MINKLLIILICTILFGVSPSYAFWKTCIDINTSRVSVWVVDPDTMGIKNYVTNEFAFISLDCSQTTRPEFAFSQCANGCSLYPDSSIKIPAKTKTLCIGDDIFVYSKRCEITHMKKGKDN